MAAASDLCKLLIQINWGITVKTSAILFFPSLLLSFTSNMLKDHWCVRLFLVGPYVLMKPDLQTKVLSLYIYEFFCSWLTLYMLYKIFAIFGVTFTMFGWRSVDNGPIKGIVKWCNALRRMWSRSAAEFWNLYSASWVVVLLLAEMLEREKTASVLMTDLHDAVLIS